MEMLVIALIAIVAFAAVLVPLFRRKPGSDDDEFDIGAEADAARPTPPVAPLASGPVTPVAPPPVNPPDAGEHRHDDVEADILRYRAALRAGTVCRSCGFANPEDAVFCAECGSRLPREDAREFE